jgi:hypothetical protein
MGTLPVASRHQLQTETTFMKEVLSQNRNGFCRTLDTVGKIVTPAAGRVKCN